jgi:SAM-dependent methyltransferase
VSTTADAAAVSPARVWDLVNGFVAYHAVRAADELGVFAALGDGPCGLAELSSRCAAKPDRLLALCTANLAAGTLDLDGEGFGLSPFAAAHLVPGRAGYLGALLRQSPGPLENWPALAETVRGAAPPRDVGSEGGAFLAELVDATFPAQLGAARATVAGPLAGELSDEPRRGRRVLDLGAGGAPWTIAVLEADPEATAVVNDLPGVIGIARRRLTDAGLLGRAELRPGDYWTIDPPGPADLVVLGHVCRAEGDAGATELVGRARDFLRPGGLLLIAEYLLDDDRRGPAQAQLLGTTMMASTSRGATFTRAQAQRWLSANGLELLSLTWPLPPTAVLLARRPAR